MGQPPPGACDADMSNYDAGHYFLTMLAPILDGHIEVEGRSHILELRHRLVRLPTALQDEATLGATLDSPFSRVPGVHFARFFILDDLVYNGRRPSNAIYDLLAGVDLVQPEAIDRVEHAWLFMVIDFDAPDGSLASLRAGSDRLWAGMQTELREIFAHCIGFEKVKTADDWFAYLRRGQVTTTMPFNDYWPADPPPSPLVKIMAASGVALVVAAVGGALGGIWPFGWPWLLLWVPLVWLAVTVAAVLKLGTTPFPPAPDSDLRSILKALHVQDRFRRFALDAPQNPAALHQAFGDFLAAQRPADLDGPAQAAGRLPERVLRGAKP